jgi:RND superfamily putative drug exporter
LFLCVTLAALAVPAARGLHVDWNYDALFSLKSSYQSRQGTEIVERHWPTGEIAPLTILVTASADQTPETWTALSNAIATGVRKLPVVDNIRTANTPLGLHVNAVQNVALLVVGGDRVRSEYLSADGQAMRIAVVLNVPPLSRSAMSAAPDIAAAARTAVARQKLAATVQLCGLTAEEIDVQHITQEDFRRVSVFCLVVILIVILVVLRDVPMSLFILFATLLSYFSTLGLACWIFEGLLGSQGLEWKVQMLLFIVLMAVGQDYSIFFAMRFAQESKRLPPDQATRQALKFTGPVISSCGLIMAATLGSIATGDVKLLVQLGMAFVIGMLIDTFIVRPLLLPPFIVLTKRTLKNAMSLGH